MVVGFKDLSLSMKILVILGWIMIGYSVFIFVLGFIAGVLGLI